MRPWIRAVLCCLAALSLPLQAAAHDTLRLCHGRLAPATTVVVADPAGDRHGSSAAAHSADASHGGHATGAAHATHATHATHAAHHGQAPEASGGMHGVDGSSGAAAADGGCVLCAGCGVSSALLPGALMRPPSAVAGQEWSAAPAARVERASRRGPERPPRVLAA